jgi:hypothetical protein
MSGATHRQTRHAAATTFVPSVIANEIIVTRRVVAPFLPQGEVKSATFGDVSWRLGRNCAANLCPNGE